METEPLTPRHRQVIVPLLKIFKVRNRMKTSEVCNRYAKAFKECLALRSFGFKNIGALENNLAIFEHLQSGEVAISTEKLLKLTVLPVLKAEHFQEEFVEFNGFPFAVLCDYFQVNTVEEMLRKYPPDFQADSPILKLTPSTVPQTMTPLPVGQGNHVVAAWSLNAAFSASGSEYGKVLQNDPEQLVSNNPWSGSNFPCPSKRAQPPPQLTSLPSINTGPFLPHANAAECRTGQSLLLESPLSTNPVSTGRAIHDPGPHATCSKKSILSHFPNDHIPLADESYLPSISIGHPDMEVYQPPRQLSAPTFSARDSFEKIKAKVDGYMQNFISVFSSKGKHFPANIAVEEARKQLKQASRYCTIKISWRDISSCSKLQSRYQRVCEFIRAFCWNCPVCSLFDLQRSILHLEEISNFAELQMGPILKHPLIKDFFKPSEAVMEVPEITAYDIHLTISKFIDCNPKRRNQKLNPEEFMEFFAKSQSVASPNELCIRITSFALAFSSNFRFRTSQRLTREHLQATTEEKIVEAVDFEINKMKRMLSRSSEQKHLLEKNPVLLLNDVFACVIPLCPSHFHSRVTIFFDMVTRNKMFRKLFQLAIYEGAYGMKSMTKKEEECHQGMQAMLSTRQGPKAMNYKSPREILHSLLPCLKRLPFPVDLASLSRTEMELVDTFGIGNFSSLGQGPFLSFIVKQPQAIEALGDKVIGTATDDAHSKTKRIRAVSFVKQMKNTSDKDLTSKLISQQFSVGSVQELGCGSVNKLLSDASQAPQSVLNPTFFFALPLLHNQSEKDIDEFKEGVLGPQTFQNALKCLQQAPLLEDLALWSHWDSIFAPSLGSLEDFLLSLPDHQRLHVLEVAPAILLKVCPSSTVQDFVTGIQALNSVSTAGHLVSLAVKAGSVYQIPTQLLAKRVQSKLEEMVAVDRDKEESEGSPAHFIYRCIVRIPVKLCAVLGKEVLIDPLRKVTSSSVVDRMLGYCCNIPTHRCHLQALGMRMGIKAWSDDYREMLREGEDPARVATYHNAGMVPDATRNLVPADLADQSSHDGKKMTSSSKLMIEGGHKSTVSPVTEDVDTSEEPVVATALSLSPEAFAEQELACKQIVDRIRQEEFGVGLKLNQRQKKIAEKQREREGRGLSRLSKELYSKDTHFVLELVQNADDNSYPPHLHSDPNAVPSLKFILTSKCITVLNNEVGFSEKNVRAICDVGQSTKDPSRAGYIGQKGIGFKSVFRVTDTPEIHSNGFHIQFDTTSGPIGYILPHWKPHFYNQETFCDEDSKRWTTQILLPLKTESSLSLNLVNKFKDIQPSLLLFLNRLRCIIVEDKDSQELRKMQRLDKKNGITEITYGSMVDRWLVVRKQMDHASQYKPEVAATELALAFPLPVDLKSPLSSRELSTQQVFAFLPLRSYGFRFIVQGDFDLPSSREDVNTDSAWNQWLREEIPSLFIEAAAKMKALAKVTDIEAMALYMQFVPMEGEVHDFFRPVAGQILQLLRGQECLPTDPSTRETDPNAFNIVSNTFFFVTHGESEVQWKQPPQLLRVPNELIRTHIPQTLLSSTLDLHYLHGGLHSAIGPDLCSQLGIGTVTVEHLIAVAEVVLKSFEEVKDKSYSLSSGNEEDSFLDVDVNLSSWSLLVQWLAQWLACVYVIMEETKNINANTLQELRRLKIIPLTNQSLVSLESGAVFFPPMTANKELQGLFHLVYDELRIIDTDLLKSEDKLITVRVMELLSLKLGVKELQAADVIRLHILPCYQAKTVKKERLQISYLAYIKHNIDQGIVPEPEMVAALKDCVLLHTNHGPKNPSTEVVHFSSEYQSKWDLCKMFPGIRWTVISPKYLEVGASSTRSRKADPSSWREFLLHLGVQSAIAIERMNHSLDPASNVECDWTSISEWKRSPDGKYVVRDYASKEFDDVVRSVECMQPYVKVMQMKALVELIDSCWSSGQEYKKYMLASYYDGSNSIELGQVNSSFATALSTNAWLPAVNYDDSPYQANTVAKPECLYKACDLFRASDANKRLLYRHVPYIGAELRDYSFIKHLHLKEDVSSEELLELLRKWLSSSIEEGQFITSLDHMQNVYLFMRRKSEEEEQDHGTTRIRDTFKSEKLVFVPFDPKTRQPDKVGKFHSVHDVCWNDNSTILYNMLKGGESIPDHLPKILSYFYFQSSSSMTGDIKHAFLYFGVSQNLKTQWLLDLLEFNASFSPRVEPKEAQNFRTVIEQVIRPHGDTLEQEYNETECSLKRTATITFAHEQLKKMKVFPSKSKKWVSLEKLFIDDAEDISKCFDASMVDFLFWPNKSGKELAKELPLHLADIFNIPLLSKSFSKAFAAGQTRPFHPLQKSMHYMVPVIQKFILTKFPLLYDPLQNQQGIDEYLKRLHFFSVIELNCIYSIQLLGNNIHSKPVSCRGYSLDDDAHNPVMYAVVNESGRITEKLSLVHVLCSIFFKDISVTDEVHVRSFLNALVMDDLQSEDDQTLFIESHQLEQSPSAETVEWCVPLPDSPKQLQSSSYATEQPKHEVVEASQEGEEHSTEETMIKMWPPNASVHVALAERVVEASGRKVGEGVKNLPQQLKGEENDTVTLDYVKKVKGEEGMQDGESEMPTSPTTPRTKTPSSKSSDTSLSQGLQRQSLSTPVSSEDHHQQHHQQQQPAQTVVGDKAAHQAKEAGKFIEERPQTRHVGNKEEKRVDTQEQVVTSLHTLGPPKPVNTPDFTNVKSVDLSSLMQTVEVDVEHGFLSGNQEDSIKMEVGRWGEWFIYNYLKHKRTLPDQTKITSIKWINEQAETGYPYDVQVEVDNMHTMYIEVKATSTLDKTMIETSWNELHFAQEKGKSYLLFRVFNAGKSADVRVKWLQDLFRHIETHPVKIFLRL